jgi:hypothetical protein
MKTINLDEAVSNLWAWLQTWMDENGGVHSYIVHHHRDNLQILSPDTWTQSPCILGLLNLYRKTGSKRWLKESSKLCDYLVNNYIQHLHTYRNANHERKPLGRPSLIGNTIASYALLEFAKEARDLDIDWQKYYFTARDNIIYLLSHYWDSSVGALINPSFDVVRHIHNMNSVAIMALVTLAEIEGDNRYIRNYAEKISNYILACQVKKGSMEGAYPYCDNMRNYITLYSLITCLGLIYLYERIKSPELLNSAEKSVSHLINFVDKKNWLICHFHRHGYPQWIPDTLLLIVAAKWLGDVGIRVKLDTQRMMSVLSRQHASGGFPLSIGFEDLRYKKGLPSKPNIRRWRDVLPTPNWNAWNFWMLSELLPKNARLREPNIRLPFIIETDTEEEEGPYQIVEDEHKVVFMSSTNQPCGIFRKSGEIADLCLINERNELWRIKKLLNKYPTTLQKLILKMPSFL